MLFNGNSASARGGGPDRGGVISSRAGHYAPLLEVQISLRLPIDRVSPSLIRSSLPATRRPSRRTISASLSSVGTYTIRSCWGPSWSLVPSAPSRSPGKLIPVCPLVHPPSPTWSGFPLSPANDGRRIVHVRVVAHSFSSAKLVWNYVRRR